MASRLTINRLFSVLIPLAIIALLTLSCAGPGGSGSSSGSDDGSTQGSVDNEPVEEEGLVTDFDFEEGEEGADYQIVGASWTEGIVGDGLMFNGYDQYVHVPNDESLALSIAGTVACWIKANSHKPYAGVLHKGEKKDFSDEAWTIQFWGSDGTIAVIIVGTDGTLLMVTSTFTLNVDEWYFIAATWDLDTVTLYINGQENISKENTVGEVRATDGGLIIGAQLSEPYNGSYGHVGFDGIIDEVVVFDRVLSPDEILQRFDAVMAQ
jgi:hypothetical protein